MSAFFLFWFLFVRLLVCLATYFLFETKIVEMGTYFLHGQIPLDTDLFLFLKMDTWFPYKRVLAVWQAGGEEGGKEKCICLEQMQHCRKAL